MIKKFRISDEQLALPFRERPARVLSLRRVSYEDRQRTFWVLAGISIFSLFIYFYAVNAIARNTALRSNLEAHLSDAGSRIGALEFSYIELRNGITKEKAGELGFSEVKSPLYVSRNAAAALTFHSE
ncbi:MAG: hypothetical protein A3J09_01055 [Candidatus Zambryskibacteria bacterium RIFCSPLOWO2_02_FULL_51_21]|uniref:Cell division protein FtsL n=1 Tax=Candidatus Zambryskibacteria bacterium RIFCSPHIGHO2_02_FULL_43_37 TaxID=1802749 RepID=A0A1G2TH20_9BACT|nr:MAG: hypothetical protein A2723_01055 [Candidatus Zambryskibacteria bacterium RIFCSPHIGHO2_01_FULL_52_18]OHA96595.1 MAG: hypothetical protein A3D49_01845 [Candidatus Zambryskibacteria bacterium RIFCSPHIGHO2_02_FULL_43_37]OHB07643.1 MAG: hypothetical protein A2944_00870 [Candidatus Zambryskibacteria bacterium RIFCSPLOWO2_01_FULL_52_12]OHB11141.1 MAG: hypothetical protein A3J09_01055 [Candidatus Zambryskibacteria bacterium RIFCSPLOWO2_02_FULL_51_21]